MKGISYEYEFPQVPFLFGSFENKSAEDAQTTLIIEANVFHDPARRLSSRLAVCPSNISSGEQCVLQLSAYSRTFHILRYYTDGGVAFWRGVGLRFTTTDRHRQRVGLRDYY